VSQSESPDRDYEKLSKAITEAVLSSEKVRKLVSEIQKKDEICPQSFMVLVLKLQSLTEGMETETEDPVQKAPKKTRRPKKSESEPDQFIDGERLSKKEIAFQEYINERFNAEEWLKKNGLIF
jgi:hypothetical protein